MDTSLPLEGYGWIFKPWSHKRGPDQIRPDQSRSEQVVDGAPPFTAMSRSCGVKYGGLQAWRAPEYQAAATTREKINYSR